MYAETIVDAAHLKAIRRRPAGAAAWRDAVREIIASEKEDLKDMQRMEEMLFDNPGALRILTRMQRRKTERIIELQTLLEYKDPKPRTVDAAPAEDPWYNFPKAG